MDRIFIVKVIKALKSGEYSQTTDRLRDDKGFCCLGVMCDVYDPNEWVMPSKDIFMWGGSSVTLPWKVAKSMGLQPGAVTKPDFSEWKIGGRNFMSLTEANDKGISFEDIANALIEYLQISHEELDMPS